MNTHEGYSKKKLDNDNVLLAGGGEKSLTEFLGGIRISSSKIQYKAADSAAAWTDLITLVNTDENVKLTPKTDNTNRPLMMINGGTSTGTLTSTSMFSTSIYANASTKMITTNGFIKNGSDSSHVLLGDGGHKAISDFSMAHSHPYLPLAGGKMTQTTSPLKFTENKLAIEFRDVESSNLSSRVQFMTSGNEALVFSNQYAYTSYIFKCGYKLIAGSDWYTQFSSTNVPTLLMKRLSVYVNSFINNNVSPSYNFLVGGTSYLGGNTYINPGALYITNNSKTLTIGALNTSWYHFSGSDGSPFYFSNSSSFNGTVYPYSNAAYDLGSSDNKWRYFYLNNRAYLDEWIQFSGNTGLYWPNSGSGTHFYPANDCTYGSFQVQGAKGGYYGITAGPGNTYLTFMSESTHQGLYNTNQGKWVIYYNRPNNYIGIGTSSITKAVSISGQTYISSNTWIGTTSGSEMLNVGGWVGTVGNTGWYNISYGGGIYMTDSTWVRVYNDRKFYVNNTSSSALHTAGGLYTTRGIQNGNEHILSPRGGSYSNGNSSVTGYIIVRFPIALKYCMMSVWIDIFNYTTDGSCSVHCGAYTYDNSFGHAPFSRCIGRQLKTRFCYDSSYYYIVIGESNTGWSYPKFMVRDMLVGHSQPVGEWLDKDLYCYISTSLPGTEYTNKNGYVISTDDSGNFTIPGNCYATHFYESSDIRLKHDISSISQSIRKFRFNNDNKLYYGFIAQELETLHPELVDNSGEYKTVNYNSAICYYIAELENRVKELEDKLKKYEEIQNI